MYNKQWKLIADLIRTRTVVQIRTHAQKYFQKLLKIKSPSDDETSPEIQVWNSLRNRMKLVSETFFSLVNVQLAATLSKQKRKFSPKSRSNSVSSCTDDYDDRVNVPISPFHVEGESSVAVVSDGADAYDFIQGNRPKKLALPPPTRQSKQILKLRSPRKESLAPKMLLMKVQERNSVHCCAPTMPELSRSPFEIGNMIGNSCDAVMENVDWFHSEGPDGSGLTNALESGKSNHRHIDEGLSMRTVDNVTNPFECTQTNEAMPNENLCLIGGLDWLDIDAQIDMRSDCRLHTLDLDFRPRRKDSCDSSLSPTLSESYTSYEESLSGSSDEEFNFNPNGFALSPQFPDFDSLYAPEHISEDGDAQYLAFGDTGMDHYRNDSLLQSWKMADKGFCHGQGVTAVLSSTPRQSEVIVATHRKRGRPRRGAPISISAPAAISRRNHVRGPTVVGGGSCVITTGEKTYFPGSFLDMMVPHHNFVPAEDFEVDESIASVILDALA